MKIQQTYIDANTGREFKTCEFETGWKSSAQALKAWRDRNIFVNGKTIFDFDMLRIGVIIHMVLTDPQIDTGNLW